MIERYDQLVTTPAGHDALALLRDATRQTNGPMELHCLRCRHIAAELASRNAWEVDDEVLTVASILHDIGLYPAVSNGGVYTSEGAGLGREIGRRHGWTEERIQACADAIERHHHLVSQLDHGAEAETLRRADLVDVSGGLIPFGLERRWLRELNRAVPRTGLPAELAREVGRALRERPLTMLRIFAG